MKEEYFWSIVIEENYIQAAIWTVKDNAANVVSLSTAVAYEDDETLVTAADECLSSCVQKLPAEANEPTKTVFGVASSWVADGQIVRVHLDKIRLLCNKLSLNPTGFVVLPEAIAHFEKSQEKTPISGVLIGIYTQSIDVSLFKLGNLAGSVNVLRSTNVTDDVVEGLARFEGLDTLPSRFLLYDSKEGDLEETKQSLIKTDWEVYEKVKFLHTPQVEIFDNERKMAAVSLAGAAEMGQTTAVIFNKNEKKDAEQEEPNNLDNIEGVVDPATLGFSTNFKDTALPQEERPPMQQRMQSVSRSVETGIEKKLGRFFGPELKEKLASNFSFIAVIVIFFLLVGGFVFYWFVPHAEVTIVVSPQTIGGKQNVKFDANASSVNPSKLTVPAKTATTTVSSDKTKTTTGTKTVGTSSKGSVTFYNVGGSTTIPSGSILTASNLQFSLDTDVQVASASGAASAATAKGNITSLGVGADYNLAGGTYFTVGDFSSSLLQAKNDSDLSGGSSQEVTAVSKDDMNSLTSDLTSALTSQGKDSLKSNLMGGNLLIDSSVIATPSAVNFDHQVGDAASTVKLSETLKVSGLTVNKKDLDSLAMQIYSNEVKNGFTMSDNQIDFQFEPKDVNFIINLLPNVNTGQISMALAGKNESDMENILSKEIVGFTSAQVTYKPNIPFFKFLPHVPAHISIIISSR